MSLAINIIEEHEHLLKSRGYDEISLNSPDKPNRLFQQLRQHVTKAIHENLYEKAVYEFELEAVGFFKNDTEIVFFKLKYSFDVEQASLSLSELNVRMDGIEKVFQFKNNYELLQSTQAVNLIKQADVVLKNRRNSPRVIDEDSKGISI